MKNVFKFLVVVFLSSTIMFACKSDKPAGTEEEIVEVSGPSSSYYNDIVFAKGGHYLNLNIGDTRESVVSKMSSLDIADEDEGAVWFEKETDDYTYNVDTYYEDNKLYSVDVFVYFYDADGNYDDKAKEDLYNDWKNDFNAKFGKADEQTEDGYTYTIWNDGNVEIEAGFDESNAYIYSYSLD